VVQLLVDVRYWVSFFGELLLALIAQEAPCFRCRPLITQLLGQVQFASRCGFALESIERCPIPASNSRTSSYKALSLSKQHLPYQYTSDCILVEKLHLRTQIPSLSVYNINSIIHRRNTQQGRHVGVSSTSSELNSGQTSKRR
jgi:hypothetical protein